jgi:outer membrane receptor protein involved in Fe transport
VGGARARGHPPVRRDEGSGAGGCRRRPAAAARGVRDRRPGDLYGEGYTLFDLKLAKNIRFAGKRFNIGVDIYNLFNNDAIRSYQATYTLDNPATPAVEVNNFGNPTTLLSPRFARLQIQVDF